MTLITDTSSKRRLPAKLAAGFAIAAILAVGAFSGSANAQYNQYYNGHYYNGGYYQAPPVVYGSPYNNGYYGSGYYGSPYYYRRRWSMAPASASACRASTSAFAKLHANPNGQRPAMLPALCRQHGGWVHEAEISHRRTPMLLKRGTPLWN
jgi:hypothetical protein